MADSSSNNNNNNNQTPSGASPATNSLTPMELDVNAATTPEQQQQLQMTPSGSTEFQNPNQVSSMPPPAVPTPTLQQQQPQVGMNLTPNTNATNAPTAAAPTMSTAPTTTPALTHANAMASSSSATAATGPTIASSSSSSAPSIIGANTTPPIAAIENDLNKREKTLAEFLAMMDNYTPIIPDAVTDYYLGRTGFDCEDVRIKRLLALAAQKFVADIATDAFQYCKVRQSGNRKTGKDRKAVLTMEDLSQALAEYGVNVKKPDYYS
ncbi:transcription initiation factor TFIID 23-30kDa subunit-domain-containing protein [Phascolomyces articulosus]|uniref:Transcription initiation factor TFIID 23-30kDa subunit-domain-containing protein n=1 Tax=Phascolomyces articulosus TaxID=60185 RepID=A0AAD5K6G7_9FUNG|nr:transcription initiation factor TFIID 23-30kDa subunit-domain-containing protein [Phascolomyces articulosus]